MPRARFVNPEAARFGALIQNLRMQRGWTLRDLASFSQISAGYLGLLERGLNLPSLTVVITLADVLGVDAGELVRHVAAGRKRSPRAVLPPLPSDQS